MDGLIRVIGENIQNLSWIAFPACFFGGIISSASPCVLPMVPLIIGFVGGYSEGSHKKAIQYSLVFTLGLTITFIILGIVAGFMGKIFGDVSQFWNYALPVLAIVLGLQLIGVINFNIGIPQRFLPKNKALIGAFLIGLLFGLIASPCSTPILGVILTFAATKRQIVYGGGLLLAYALGQWMLVLGAGISAGFAQKVLESKDISNISKYSKMIGGLILIGVGVYLLASLFW